MSVEPTPRADESSPIVPSADDIQDWIVQKLSKQMRIDREEIDLDVPLVELGLDSMQLVVLVGDLEDWLGIKFSENPLIEHPTMKLLSQYLADLASGSQRFARDGD
jgi:polyketide synthase 12